MELDVDEDGGAPHYSDALQIPTAVRKQIDERDQMHCRLCGIYDQYREVHHLIFGGAVRGMGGRRVHNPEEMVSLCKRCHMRAHSEKSVWVKWLLLAIEQSGTTALQHRRWAASRLAHRT